MEISQRLFEKLDAVLSELGVHLEEDLELREGVLHVNIGANIEIHEVDAALKAMRELSSLDTKMDPDDLTEKVHEILASAEDTEIEEAEW